MMTLVSCWLVPRTVTVVLAIATIGIGLITNAMDLQTLPALLLLALSGWQAAQKHHPKRWRLAMGGLFILSAVVVQT